MIYSWFHAHLTCLPLAISGIFLTVVIFLLFFLLLNNTRFVLLLTWLFVLSWIAMLLISPNTVSRRWHFRLLFLPQLLFLYLFQLPLNSLIFLYLFLPLPFFLLHFLLFPLFNLLLKHSSMFFLIYRSFFTFENVYIRWVVIG